MRVNKIGHIYKCKCKLCVQTMNKSEEQMINLVERYYLETLINNFKFNKIRGKKPKRRLYISLYQAEEINPFRHKIKVINCRKCHQLRKALEGYRWTCIFCCQENNNKDYKEWQSWNFVL